MRRIASVPLQYAPGTGWNYSLSIDVVGAVIEAVTGQPLADAVDALVLRPLGTRDTGFVARDAARLATPYVNDTPQPHRLAENEAVPIDEGSVGVTYSPSRALDKEAFASGGAGMVGTAGDVLNVLDTLRAGGGAILPAELVDEMGRIHTGNPRCPTCPARVTGSGFPCCATRARRCRRSHRARGAGAASTVIRGSSTARAAHRRVTVEHALRRDERPVHARSARRGLRRRLTRADPRHVIARAKGPTRSGQ